MSTQEKWWYENRISCGYWKRVAFYNNSTWNWHELLISSGEKAIQQYTALNAFSTRNEIFTSHLVSKLICWWIGKLCSSCTQMNQSNEYLNRKNWFRNSHFIYNLKGFKWHYWIILSWEIIFWYTSVVNEAIKGFKL